MMAIVTGASSGTGRAVAIVLARDRYSIILLGRDNKRLEDVREKLTKEFPNQKFYTAVVDLKQFKSITQFLDQTAIPIKETTILINCAGISLGNEIVSTSKDEWDESLAVNLSAPFFLSQAIAKIMIQYKTKGSIVNIASLAGVVGAKKPAYAASKAGLIGLTKAFAGELGQYGIRVNAIVPGAVDTPLVADWTVDKRRAVIKKTPLGRIATPAEIAEIVSFLVSGRASFLTGAIINATGGQYLGS